MRAMAIESLDGPRAMRMQTVADPVMGPRDVLIEVVAAGISYPDLLRTQGRHQHRPALPFIPGGEVAGIVTAKPRGSRIPLGAMVMAYVGTGGLAELVAAPRHLVFPVPPEFDANQAAGFIVNYHTASFALHDRGRLRRGETVLVHAASGGLGLALVQLAKAAGAHVIGVASTPEKRSAVFAAGAEETLSPDTWAAQLKGRAIHLVADLVGGTVFDDSLRILAPSGRVLVLGFLSGVVPEVRVNRLLMRNVSVVGAGWGAYLTHDPSLARRVDARLRRLVSRGELIPPVGRIYPMADAALALEALEERHGVGKAIVDVAGASTP